MTLPPSGPLTFAQIQTEIYGGPAGTETIPNANWRTLAGKPTGPLVIPNDFWGKSWRNVSVVGSAVANGATSTHTFVGVAFGSASSSRVLIACIIVESEVGAGQPVTAVSIGGVGAAGETSGTFTDPPLRHCGASLFYAAVPSGTSGNVAVTWSGGGANVGLILLSMTGATTPAFNTAEDGATTPGTSSTALLDVPGNGIIIAASAHQNLNDTVWSGITERSAISTTSGRLEVGFDIAQGAQTDRNITASWSGSVNRGIVAASFS